MSDRLKEVNIYTDGACLGNPGAGGYGVVLLYGEHRKELSGGFRLTTNNRMEIMAKCTVTVYSDSQYVINSIAKGWAKGWQAKGWRKKDGSKAVNPDLWAQLLDLCDRHQVEFRWVRGHSGNVENERCDRLAVAAAQQADLPVDLEYEQSA
jgi:ribonuclease HI